MSESIFRQFNERDLNYFYYDKKFNEKGMDYQRYIKLRYESINKKHIKEVYTSQGWYLIWLLMCRAEKQQYIKTTINCIADESKITNKKIKDLLIYLHKNDIIVLSQLKNITYNQTIEIFIKYNDDTYYTFDTTGYNGIPIDYIRPILLSITPDQWAILSVLLTKYSYYTVSPIVNEKTGEIEMIYKQNHYSFPTMRQMEDFTGVSKSTVQRELKIIEDSKYPIIVSAISDSKFIVYDEEEQRFRAKKPNNIYKIPLFERIEYNYYHKYSVKVANESKRSAQLIKDLKKKDFEELAKTYTDELRTKDYLDFYFKKEMEAFNKCLLMKSNKQENEAQNMYDGLRESRIIL